MNSSIPPVAHFIWLGQKFPWAYGLSVRSAALCGGFEKVILHHDADISNTPGFSLFKYMPNVTTHLIHPKSFLRKNVSRGEELANLYSLLDSKASQSNVLRAAILVNRGGVYLDTDTITVSSFLPLLKTGVFCGEERIVLPVSTMRSKNIGTWTVAGARLAARDLFRRVPHGWQPFRRIEHHYPTAVNNAVIGSSPSHPLVLEMLDEMVRMPRKQALKRYALGTSLLQDKVARYKGTDLEVHAPERFYALPPEISEHWFRHGKSSSLDQMIGPRAITVHWYASVRTKRIIPKINQDYVIQNSKTQPFSALALPYADCNQYRQLKQLKDIGL